MPSAFTPGQNGEELQDFAFLWLIGEGLSLPRHYYKSEFILRKLCHYQDIPHCDLRWDF